MAEERLAYSGPYVVLEPDALGYRVTVKSPPQQQFTRTFHGKDAAWSYARELWTDLRLPFRDLTEQNVSRTRAGGRA